MRRIVFIVLLGCVLVAGAVHPTTAFSEASTSPDQITLSKEDIQGLIHLFEDEKAREAFVQKLKALSQLTETKTAADQPEPQQLGFLDGIYQALETWSERASNMFLELIDRIPLIPGEAKKLFMALVDSTREFHFWATLGALAAGMIIALSLFVVLRRRRPSEPVEKPVLWRRIGRAFIDTITGFLPFLILLVFEFLVLPLVNARPGPRDVIVFLCAILFGYKAILAAVHAILRPEEPLSRIVSVSDENANYLWVWVHRLALYTVFFLVVIRLTAYLGVDPELLNFVRGVLLLVYPFMLTVFVLQVRHDLKQWKIPEAVKEDAIAEEPVEAPKWRKFVFSVLRVMWVPAIVYVWVIFFLIISRYRYGLDYLISATWGSILTIIVFWLINLAEKSGFRRLFSISSRVTYTFPELEDKANRYLRFIEGVVRGLIGLVGLLTLAQVWGIPVVTFVGSKAGTSLIKAILAIAITVGIVVVIIESSRLITTRLLTVKNGIGPSQKRATLAPLIRTTVVVAVCFVGGVVILAQIGVNIGPILAGAGIIGLGIGLGAQTLVKDMINGLFILIQGMISVGDVVTLGSHSGVVESVGLRTVQLRDLAGNVHIIPNSAIDAVTNMTKEYSRCVFEIGVAYREDVDEVMAVLKEIGADLQSDPVFGLDILEPLEILGLDRFDDSAVIIKARFKTRPVQQWGVAREFNRRLKRVFDERGIEIPFPHQTIYMGQPKSGEAPPLEIRVHRPEPPEGQET